MKFVKQDLFTWEKIAHFLKNFAVTKAFWRVKFKRQFSFLVYRVKDLPLGTCWFWLIAHNWLCQGWGSHPQQCLVKNMSLLKVQHCNAQSTRKTHWITAMRINGDHRGLQRGFCHPRALLGATKSVCGHTYCCAPHCDPICLSTFFKCVFFRPPRYFYSLENPQFNLARISKGSAQVDPFDNWWGAAPTSSLF